MFVLTSLPKQFIPESLKDIEKPITFIVTPPKRKDVLKLQELILGAMKEDEEMGTVPLVDIMNVYLDSCITGWENVVDETGKAVEFNKENFALFNDVEILTELYSFLKELSESTTKN